MAEKKEKKLVASENEVTMTQAQPTGNATGYRIGAIICWVLGLVCEVFALLFFKQKFHIFGDGASIDLVSVIALLVIDLIFVIIGSSLWKKANHIDPASEANKIKFWLWNNLGVIVSAVAFIPFVIIALTDKNADKTSKTVAVIVAAVACLIGGFTSYDYNPVSSEQLQAATNALGDTTVYWTEYGNSTHKYHIDSDCQHLKNTKSDEIKYGTVEQAFAGNATALCKTCQKKHQDIEGINNVSTGDEAATSADTEAETEEVTEEAADAA